MQSRKQDHRCTNGHTPIASLHTGIFLFRPPYYFLKNRNIGMHTETDLTVISLSLLEPKVHEASHESQNKSVHPEKIAFLTMQTIIY